MSCVNTAPSTGDLGDQVCDLMPVIHSHEDGDPSLLKIESC